MSLSLLLVVATLRGNLVTEKSDTDSVVTPSLLTDREEWSTALGMETTRRKIMRLPSVHDENSQVWIFEAPVLRCICTTSLLWFSF